MRSAFRGKLLVLNGIELGQPAYDIETANKIINSHDYDQILGSVHNLRGGDDFYFIKRNDGFMWDMAGTKEEVKNEINILEKKDKIDEKRKQEVIS